MRKSALLAILQQNESQVISVEQLKTQLYCSEEELRNMLDELVSASYPIVGDAQRGYRYVPFACTLSPDAIKAHQNLDCPMTIEVHEVVTSTNDLAKTILLGKNHYGLVVANEQTKGRGRMERNFYSPPETGIYLSLVTTQSTSADSMAFLSSYSALAVVRAVYKVLGISLQIKWINDLYYHDHKVGGILCEVVWKSDAAQIERIIVGIGLNVSTRFFPPSLQDVAGSLVFEPVDRNQLIATIVEEWINLFQNANPTQYVAELRTHSYLLGHEIVVKHGHKHFSAVALDYTEQGGLLVKRADGEQLVLNSADISILRVATHKDTPLLQEKSIGSAIAKSVES
ncbi:MAG: biotin--[acetyl-CoA-carboxylase] ligase [Erysipelotrichaceae bacterium]